MSAGHHIIKEALEGARSKGAADAMAATLQRVDSKIDEVLRRLDEWNLQMSQATDLHLARLMKGASSDLASAADINLSGMQTTSEEQRPRSAATSPNSSHGLCRLLPVVKPLQHVTEEAEEEEDYSIQPPAVSSSLQSVRSTKSKDKTDKRRGSGHNHLPVPKKLCKAALGIPIASIDMSTFAEQLNSRLVGRRTEKMVPSMMQMNSAFLHSMVENHSHSGHSSRKSSRSSVRGSSRRQSACSGHPDMGSSQLSNNDNSYPDLPKHLQSPCEEDEEALRDQEIENLARPTPGDEELSEIVPLPGAPPFANVKPPKKRPASMVDLAHKEHAKIMDDFNLDQHATVSPSTTARQRTDAASNLFKRVRPCVWYTFAFLAVLASCSVITLSAVGLMSSVGFGFIIMSSNLYTVAAISCVFFLRRALVSEDFVLALEKLHNFVVAFEIEWGQVTGIEWRMYALVWVLTVSGFGAAIGLEEWKLSQEAWQPLIVSGDTPSAIIRIVCTAFSFIAFCMCAAAVILVDYVQSHLLLGLDKSLDCWCCSVLDGDFRSAVESWNCMQALLKAVGREMAGSFIASQAVGAIGFIYFLASTVTLAFQSGFNLQFTAVESVSSVPLLLLFLLNLRVCWHGAALTEKCRAIPAFVNQIPSPDEDPIDHDRTYLVRFITDSAAGFSVKDITLTREKLMKNFVMVGGILSGFVGVLSRVT